jgi:phosphorylcholine metabolism protein LicD
MQIYSVEHKLKIEIQMIKFIKNLFKRHKQLNISVVSVSVCPNCKGTGYISSNNAISLCLLCGGKQTER